MVLEPFTINRVRTTLEQIGNDCPLEEVGNLCPDMTWNQVFLAIDHLSRIGQVRVTVESGRVYWVRPNRPVAADSGAAEQERNMSSLPLSHG